MTIKRALMTLAAVGAVALVAGCGSEDDEPAAANSASSAAECPNGGNVRMAVEPYESSALLLPAYKPIAEQLGRKLGCKVSLLITPNYTAEIEAMRAKKLEIAQFGPFGYTLANKLAKAEAVAIFAGPDGKAGAYTASIVAPKSKGITTLRGVKGKSFAYSDPASTSGYLIPAFLLKNAGIDPRKGVKPVFAGSHPSAYEALRNGKVDAGELNSEQIEILEKQGNYEPDKLVTLAKSDPIPLDPITVRGDLPEAFKQRVADAIVSLDFSTLPKKARDVLIGQELVPVDDSAYDPIRDVQSELGLGLEDLG